MSDARQGSDGKREPSRALVPAEGGRGCAGGGYARPLATFIAQVLACRTKLPDFRQRRRAEPPAATAAYAAMQRAAGPRRFEKKL